MLDTEVDFVACIYILFKNATIFIEALNGPNAAASSLEEENGNKFRRPIAMNESKFSFAFDFRSPLKKYYNYKIPINEDPRMPTEADFFNIPQNDYLQEIYRIDAGKEEAPVYFDTKQQDPHLSDKNRLKLLMDKAFTYPRIVTMHNMLPVFSGIFRDKAMDVKLMYVPNPMMIDKITPSDDEN